MSTKKTKTTVAPAAQSVVEAPCGIKECECGCREGKECTCGCECGCKKECACGCDCTKLLVKSAVTLVSAAAICFSICCAGDKISSAISSAARVPVRVAGEKAPHARPSKAAKPTPAPEAAAPAPQKAPTDLVESVLADKTNHVLGNAKGKFVIIEFFDYQCGWCKRTNAAMSEAVKQSGNIRWVLIDTPIFGEASETIARFAMAAGFQGKFAEFHKAIGEATGKLAQDDLVAMGKKLGLDTKKLIADATGDKTAQKLAANRELATRLNINGVPMLIVDGNLHPGALFGEELDAVVAQSKK